MDISLRRKLGNKTCSLCTGKGWRNLRKTFIENVRYFGFTLKTVNIIKGGEIGGDCAFVPEI